MKRALENVCWLLVFNFILHCFNVTVAESSNLKRLDLLGFLPMSGSGWTGGAACLPAALMATRHVNEKHGLLDGYNLTYNWVDTQVYFVLSI